MGQADYFEEGQWNFYCQECGKKLKSGEARYRWDNFWVGPECWEIRNPQDYVRGIPDNPSVPWSTGNIPPKFIDTNAGPTQTTGPSQMLDSYMLDSTMLG